MIRIALCRECDVAPLMRFIDAEWRAGHVLSRDERLLRWQFDGGLFPSAHSSAPTVMLAWRGDTIVGMLGLTGSRMSLAGTATPAVWLSHWFVSRAYRHDNVAFGLLYAVFELGFDVVAASGANARSTALLTAIGFDVIPALPRWIGVVDVRQTARFLVDLNNGLGLTHAQRVCERYRADIGAAGTIPEGRDVQVRPWRHEHAAAWDDCWTELAATTIVSTIRDAQFLRWRYLCHPRWRYEVRVAIRESDRRVLGLTAYRFEPVRERPETVMRVVECLAVRPAEAALANAILHAARERRVAYVDFYCSAPSAARGFEQAGFRRETFAPNQPAFPTRLQPPEADYFRMTVLMRLPPGRRSQLATRARAGRVYLTKSDGDQDRPN